MCVPYASDNAGMPVGGLGGLAGTAAPALAGLTGTPSPAMPNLTGSGTIPTAPTAGGTVLSGGSANTGLAPAAPAPAAPTPAPAPAAPAPAAPVARTVGRDPLPQTSGHFDIVSQTGHDSLSPLADAIVARRGRGSGGPPSPPARPTVETAALPGTVPASAPPAASDMLPNGLPSVEAMEREIRKEASRRGIDPEVAVAVAKSEGLRPNTWQSTISGGGGPGNREASFGPFQLNDFGMGKEFTNATGLRADDPSTWREQISFVLDRVTSTGWEPFHGAARVGIGSRQGLPASATPVGFGGGLSTGPRVAANGAPLVAFDTGGDTLSGGTGSDTRFGSRGGDTLAATGADTSPLLPRGPRAASATTTRARPGTSRLTPSWKASSTRPLRPRV